MRHTTLMLVGLLMVGWPSGARAQGGAAAFQHNSADVNGVRLHYASVGQGPLVLFLHDVEEHGRKGNARQHRHDGCARGRPSAQGGNRHSRASIGRNEAIS